MRSAPSWARPRPGSGTSKKVKGSAGPTGSRPNRRSVAAMAPMAKVQAVRPSKGGSPEHHQALVALPGRRGGLRPLQPEPAGDVDGVSQLLHGGCRRHRGSEPERARRLGPLAQRGHVEAHPRRDSPPRRAAEAGRRGPPRSSDLGPPAPRSARRRPGLDIVSTAGRPPRGRRRTSTQSGPSPPRRGVNGSSPSRRAGPRPPPRPLRACRPTSAPPRARSRGPLNRR